MLVTSCSQWESEDDYIKHYQEMRNHYQPVGPPQEQVVRDLAHLFWKKRRLNIASQLAYVQHPNAPAMADAGRNGWEGLGRYLQETSADTARLSTHAREAVRASSSTMVLLCQLLHTKVLEQSLSSQPTEAEQKARSEAGEGCGSELTQLLADDFLLAVPELTCRIDVKLNAQISLRHR
jgi:hypothetical protein